MKRRRLSAERLKLAARARRTAPRSAADTSSAAAAAIPVVDGAAAAWAARSAAPIPVKSCDAEAKTSGETNTNEDIGASIRWHTQPREKLKATAYGTLFDFNYDHIEQKGPIQFHSASAPPKCTRTAGHESR